MKLTDFGIARAKAQVRLTQAGYIKGKPGYLAPEQLADEALDGRADLFAVGITLHEMLTGQPLFSNGSDDRETYEVLEMPLMPPSHTRREVPKELDAIVMKLLERKIDKRWVSARAAAAAVMALPAGLAPSAEGRKQLANTVKDAIAFRERSDGGSATLPAL